METLIGIITAVVVFLTALALAPFGVTVSPPDRPAEVQRVSDCETARHGQRAREVQSQDC
ncbi:MAG: hypothetical protein ACK4E3_11285 [Brevundimonas sp.]|uniref:hypothetical protein n=1 Tax=Brevundimonas sp. TaxID=1871086 RepID=UPI00391DACE1